MHISKYHLYVGLIFLAAFDTTYFIGIFLIVIFKLVSYFCCVWHYLLYRHISNCHLYVGLLILAALDTTHVTFIFLIIIFMLVSNFLLRLTLLTLHAYF